MADEAEDVLELDDELEVEETEGEETETDDEATASDDDEDEGETFVGFADEEDEDEAAPASGSESSVIREMRRAMREKDRQIAELQRGTQPAKVELGPKPTLESCDYDEEAFEAKLTDWHGRKAEVTAQEAQAEAEAERQRAEWEARAEAFKADKATLGVADFDDAEAEVFSVLPNDVQALILLSEKPAALVYALHRSPAKLEQLSKLNLAQAAMQLGRWERDIKVMKRKAPAPDRPVMGKAAASADKTLERLERDAARTGNRTELIRYRKQLSAKG
jgi:hypothetical protein